MEPGCVKQLRQIHLLGRWKTSHKFWAPHPLVGFSSFCFIVPAIVFFSTATCIICHTNSPLDRLTVVHLWFYTILGILFTCATLTSALADYVFIKKGHRSVYGSVDVVTAITTFWVCIVDFALRAPLLEAVLLPVIAAIAHTFSGMSTSFKQWVWRHCLWHVVAGSISTYGCLRCPPAEDLLRDHLPWFLLYTSSVYILATFVLGLVCFMLPRGTTLQLWEMGARHAGWHPVKSNSPEEEEEAFSSSSSSIPGTCLKVSFLS